MYKLEIEYNTFLGDEDNMYLLVRLIDPIPREDGIYIVSDCIVGTNLLKNLTKKRID